MLGPIFGLGTRLGSPLSNGHVPYNIAETSKYLVSYLPSEDKHFISELYFYLLSSAIQTLWQYLRQCTKHRVGSL